MRRAAPALIALACADSSAPAGAACEVALRLRGSLGAGAVGVEVPEAEGRIDRTEDVAGVRQAEAAIAGRVLLRLRDQRAGGLREGPSDVRLLGDFLLAHVCPDAAGCEPQALAQVSFGTVRIDTLTGAFVAGTIEIGEVRFPDARVEDGPASGCFGIGAR